MDTKWFGAIDLFLVFAPVLAFAFWELYSLKKSKRSDERAARDDKQQ